MLSTLAALTIALAFGLVYLARRRVRLPYPPGPPGKLIIGNALEIPHHFSWLYYTDLYKRYGDVVHLSALNQHLVILNTMEAVNDIMIKRAAVSSDRPKFVMGGELMQLDQSLVLAQHGPQWRAQRRMFRQFLSNTSMREYHGRIHKESFSFVGRLHDRPAQYSEEFKLSAVRHIASVTYGIHVETCDDPYVEMAEGVARAAGDAFAPGAYLVDLIPPLKYIPIWFPGAHFRRHGKKWADAAYQMISVPFERVKQDLAAGTAIPSFTGRLLESDSETNGLDDRAQMWLSGTMYGAGTENVWAAVMRFFLAMTLYPDVQRKAQNEIDSVVGPDRLPNFDDQERLPYVEAVIKEVLRWYIMTPIGVPHRLTEDVEYKGYLLPKDSILIPNSSAISRDLTMYPDPDTFNPDRFMVSNRGSVPLDPSQIVFGYGRWKCPGLDFANSVLWSSIVSILATTTILKALDANGKEITPELSFSGDVSSSPNPFKCRIEVHSAERLALARHGVA